MRIERNAEYSLAGASAVVGSPFVVGEFPTLTHLKGMKGVVRVNVSLVDNMVDGPCRPCDKNMSCAGPVECIQFPNVADSLRISIGEISSLYNPPDRERVHSLVEEFNILTSRLEMDAIQNPPTNEYEIREYRESTLWPWAQMIVALAEGSNITTLTNERDVVVGGNVEGGNVRRLFFASAYSQVFSDYYKFKYHQQQGILGFGSTLADEDKRRLYCRSVADEYAEKAIKSGVSSKLLTAFKYGYTALREFAELLPDAARYHPFFTT